MNDNNVATIYFRYQDSNSRRSEYHPIYLHPMNVLREVGCQSVITANGGYTVVVVRSKQTNRYHIGVSRCSETDRFQRKTGREKALQYAKQAEEQGIKISYPVPHGKRERAALSAVLEEIPMRFLVDDDTIRKVDPYDIP